MGHRIVCGGGDGVDSPGSAIMQGILSLPARLFQRVHCSRPDSLPGDFPNTRFGLDSESNGDSVGSDLDCGADKLEDTLLVSRCADSSSDSYTVAGKERVRDVLVGCSVHRSVWVGTGHRNSFRDITFQGITVHPGGVLFDLVRRVSSLVVWRAGLRVHFLKRGHPLYRKAGIPAWKVWASRGFGVEWCVLVDRPDLWSASFIAS